MYLEIHIDTITTHTKILSDLRRKCKLVIFILYILGFPGGSAGKESTCNVGDLASIPGLGRWHGKENSYPHQYSGLKNSMEYSPWGCRDTIERLSL